ncbi:MAG: nucleotidyltransferase family protein [Candidatus Geothermarchaeales archaeon]
MQPKVRENLLLVELACKGAVTRTDVRNFDLTYVVDKAIENSIFLHAYRALEGVAIEEPNGWRHVSRLYFQYTANLARWFDESVKLASLFREHGLSVMPVKGVLLAHLYYPDRFLRFSSDMDFVFKTAAGKAKADGLLSQRGYRLIWSSPKESEYLKHLGRVSIHCETHSFIASLSGTYEYPILKGLWAGSSLRGVGGVEMNVMRPEHALMILCLHTFSEGIFSLRDLSDAHHILNDRSRFQWDVVAHHALEEGWKQILHLPLNIIAATLKRFTGETSIPERVLGLVHSGSANRNSVDIVREILEHRGWTFPVLVSSFPLPSPLLRSPYLLNVIAPRAGPQTMLNSLKRALWELYQIFAMVVRDYGSRYGLRCLRRWVETYILSPPVSGSIREWVLSL